MLCESGPAITLLERLLPRANHETRAWIKHDSDFDQIRDHPDWARVQKAIE
jgi:adenylate cyclase